MNTAVRKNPYLSIVIASRNDDHGGDLIRRRQNTINGLLEQLEKYHIDSELILVEWNPPKNKDRLKDIINWPAFSKHCTIRIIEVSSLIHKRYKYSNLLPMNVVTAVNTGIKRARGIFVLPGTIDSLFSNELMAFISKRELKENERYRVDRCDVSKKVLEFNSLEEQLKEAEKNIICGHGFKSYGREGLPDLHTDACGDFQLMSRNWWYLLAGYREGDIIAAYADSLLSYASFSAGVKEVILRRPMRIYHIEHGDRFVDRVKIQKPIIEKFLSFIFYPLRPALPKFISKKIVFIYHKIVKKRRKSEAFGVPVMDYIQYLDLARDIVSGKHSYVLNNEQNWGLGKEKLPETVVRTADWDTK